MKEIFDNVRENMNGKKSEVIKVLILAIVVIWIILFFIDYFRARQSKIPIFCINETIKEYEDGTTYSCTGLGYKMYKYERTSIPITIQFGPFFIQERTK